ncbi:MAG: phosphoribosylformylglycinamidine synthase subunit PurL [Saprospirales bacterium]|nr:MAG: phosphoribosylformylglycinamidine synthase subunit PurL [Saprospirales bacterium]
MSQETKPGVETAEKLGLLKEEYDKIVDYLGREPNFTELSVYSVMWSEHCSYKNSIKWIKTLPRKGENLLVEAGEENAGLVDIGDGLACAFKMESHNHPSAIEPYQGAATGVGGIHRDIFTMGARPIAALNSLRFGDLDTERTKHLLKGVVRGIGDYGNCLGVPTIGGETYFHPSYQQNILVNAMSIGIVKVGETASAVAPGPGNPVFIVGSATGKDGIHGATFASADLTEDSADDLPSVQVGDPFQEKLLLEASLEALKTGAVEGMQDMGAAGISCSTSEMSAKSGTGMVIHLDKVPLRQENMHPFEILLSESQERMLVVAKKGSEDKLLEVYKKWDLECVQIGEVTDCGRLEYFMHGEKVADIPAASLVLGGGAPVYDRDYQTPAYFKKIDEFDIQNIPQPTDLVLVAKKLMASSNIASKKWIYNQYDSTVRTNTLSFNSPSDASVIRIKGTGVALAATSDCNSSYVYADPFRGGAIAVSEAARNLVCTGAKPLAITNCLNFGNPYNPEVYYQFVYAIKGMAAACKQFNTPVTGGNVSFYNHSVLKSGNEPVYPTPTIGMIGIIQDQSKIMTMDFKQSGDLIIMLGDHKNDIGSSEYLRITNGPQHSPVPDIDLTVEKELHDTLLELIDKRLIKSAHDISEGGLFACLAESGMERGLGFEIVSDSLVRKDAFLFGESQSRAVVSIDPNLRDLIFDILDNKNLKYHVLGNVTDGSVTIDSEPFGNIDEYREIHENTIANKIGE